MSSGRKWFFLCIALVFVIGFLSGIIAGPLVTRQMYGHRPGDHRGMPPPMGMEMGPRRHGGPGPMDEHGRGEEHMKTRVVDEMSRELSLTGDQKKQLSKIFDTNEPELLTFHNEMRKRMDDYRKKMDGQILQILNDKQKEKFKEFTKRFNEN
jgi:hypothetical protein